MATLAQATNYNLSGYSPVQKMDKTTSAGGSYQQVYPSQPSQFLRSTVPQVGNASPDSQRSYYNGGLTPQYRVPVLNNLSSLY